MRHQKDRSVMAKAAGDDDMRREAQEHINLLASKYKKFSDASGLPTKMERARVAGYRRVKTKAELTKSGKDDIISSRISGARNPFGKAAKVHANTYYETIRNTKNDIEKISKSTGYSLKEIQDVKNFIFNDFHDLGNGKIERFEPDFVMAQSWQRLTLGVPEKHDLTLISHELMEKDLISKGYSQAKAHILTTRKFNYGKEAMSFYDNIKKYKKE